MWKDLFLPFVFDINYIKHLDSLTHHIYLNKKRYDYENVPYIGIVVFNNGMNYHVPLISAKQKHLKLKNPGKDYLII